MRSEAIAPTISRGAIVQILGDETQDWEGQLADVLGLPDVNHVELWIEDIPTGPSWRRVSKSLAGIPVTIHGPFLHLSLCSRIDEVRKISRSRVADVAQLANQLEAAVLTVHAGPTPMFDNQDDAHQRLAESLIHLRGETSAILCLENMARKSGTLREGIQSLIDLERMLEYVPDLNFTLDIGHCLENGEDALEFLHRFSKRVCNIHLHDGRRGGPSHLRLGDGDLNLEAFESALMHVEYSGFVALETIGWADTEASWRVWSAPQMKSRPDSSPRWKWSSRRT